MVIVGDREDSLGRSFTEAAHAAGYESLRPWTDRLEDTLRGRSLTVFPLKNIVNPEDIRAVCPEGPVYVCDFLVRGIEQGIRHNFGFEKDGIFNIDHHAEIPEFTGPISSGNLASRFVRERGAVASGVPVGINHLDVDSFVSSLIMIGALPSECPVLERAVIQADHLGGNDPFIDLLQSLNGVEDLTFAARNISALIAGRELDPRAMELLSARERERERVREMLRAGTLRVENGVAWAILDRSLESDVVLPLVPDAVIILLFSPSPHNDGRLIVRTRLGQAAPSGLTLFDIGLPIIEPTWGGRWNAGSNSRSGGSHFDPHRFIGRVRERLEGHPAMQKS